MTEQIQDHFEKLDDVDEMLEELAVLSQPETWTGDGCELCGAPAELLADEGGGFAPRYCARGRIAELEKELAERERMIAIAAFYATCKERWKDDTTTEESVKHYIRLWLEEAREPDETKEESDRGNEQ